MSVHRLKTDFRFTLIMAMGGLGVVIVTPFAVWRWLRHEPEMAMFDLGILAVVLISLVWAWRGGPLHYVAYFSALAVTAAIVLTSLIAPETGRYWLFVAVMFNALLLPRAEIAALLSMIAVAVALIFAPPLPVFQHATVASTLVMTILFAYVFASRAENQRKRFETLAFSDPLTGLDNRRAFDAVIEQMLGEAATEGQAVGLAVLDLDEFKAINDAHGHDAGDQVLRQLARLMSDYLRASDRVFRLGGEEFVLLLPGTDAEGMQTRMDNLRRRIESGLRCGGQAVTASIGASAWRPGDTATSWLMRADAAMYRAKRDGRNRVMVQ